MRHDLSGLCLSMGMAVLTLHCSVAPQSGADVPKRNDVIGSAGSAGADAFPAAGNGASDSVAPPGAASATAREAPELASRSQGVAPLHVFFDATGVGSIASPPMVEGRLEYSDFAYEWQFGDAAAGEWGTDGLSKDTATGHVAAHVYEHPGTYEARLTVTTSSGDTEQHVARIVVDDPEVVFAGDATVCVSSSGVFDDCPSGAVQLTTGNFTEVGAHVEAGRRVLLRRGDAFTTTDSVRLETSGPFTLGAFGPCSSPDRHGICANAPQIMSSLDGAVLSLKHSRDVRIMDVRGVGGAEGSFWSGTTEVHRVLTLRVQLEGFEVPMSLSTWDTADHSENALQSCLAYGAALNILYIGGAKLSVLGNEFRDAQNSHIVRVWKANRASIAHNELSGASMTSGTGRHALKLHGPKEESLTTEGGGRQHSRTQYVILQHNTFGTSGPWPVAVGPQDDGSDERISDVVVEKNRFVPTFGSENGRKVAVALHVWARAITIRNNVFSGYGASDGFKAILVGRRGIEPAPHGVRIFNNTIHLPADAESGPIIEIAPSSEATVVKNNLAQAGSGTPAFVEDQGIGTVAEQNVIGDDVGFIHDAADPLSCDYALAEGSIGRDVGAAVPLHDDFAGNPRPQGGAFDLGAYESTR